MRIRIAIILCVSFYSLLVLNAQAVPGFRFSAEDMIILERGEVITRALPNQKSLAIEKHDASSEELLSIIATIRPNYLSEIIAVLPNNPGSLERMVRVLANVKGYVGIPYYSRQNKIIVDLFSKMEILADTQNNGFRRLDVLLNMDPFADYRTRFEYRVVGPEGNRVLFFKGTNLDNLVYYGKVKAVDDGKMLWLLYAREAGDHIIYYGVGAMKAFDAFGIARSRLEASLMGRVESFFAHIRRETIAE